MIKQIKVKKFIQEWNRQSKENIETGVATKEMADEMVGVYASIKTSPMLEMLFSEDSICEAVITESEYNYTIELKNLDVNGSDNDDNTIKIKIPQDELDVAKKYGLEETEGYEDVFTVEHHKKILENAIEASEVSINFETIVKIENTTVISLMEGFVGAQDSMRERYPEEELELFLKDEGAILTEFKKVIDLMKEMDETLAEIDDVSVELLHDSESDSLRLVLSYEGQEIKTDDIDRKKYLKQLVDLAFIIDVEPVELMQAKGYSWEDFKFYLEESVKAMELSEVA